MKSPHATDHLVRFLWQPLPTAGTLVEGEIAERTALAILQAKAVDGLAYLRTAKGDLEVLRAVSNHPEIAVRAEAITAYLWNHGDSAAARSELKKYVRSGEEVYLDRVRRVPGERAAAFDEKLQVFLKAHPERIPPAPVHLPPHTKKIRFLTTVT